MEILVRGRSWKFLLTGPANMTPTRGTATFFMPGANRLRRKGNLEGNRIRDGRDLVKAPPGPHPQIDLHCGVRVRGSRGGSARK